MDTIEDHRAQQEALSASETDSGLEAAHAAIRRHLGTLLYPELKQCTHKEQEGDEGASGS